jgi:hypothetical protein
MKRRRKASAKASMMMSFEGCGGDRGKGKKKDSTVDKIVKEIRPESDRRQHRYDQATGAVMTGIGFGIGLACPPCAVAFRIIWGIFDFLLSEITEENEKQICEAIMEKAHRAMSTKLPVASRNAAERSVWDLLNQSPDWAKYVKAVDELVEGSRKKIGRETPEPDPLERTETKSTVSFLLNVIPTPSIAHAAVRFCIALSLSLSLSFILTAHM